MGKGAPPPHTATAPNGAVDGAGVAACGPANLPKVEDARILVEDGYVFYLIAENADAGEAAFHAYVEAQA